jgi:tetratricopeptide (TPR) repeat protein
MQSRCHFTRLIIGLILLLYNSPISYGQQYASIYRKNGDRITGRWLGADGQDAQIEYEGKRLSIPLDQVTIHFTTDINLIPDVQAEKYFRNAESFLELGMRAEAKNAFQNAIEAFPKYADAHYRIGLLLQEEGKNDEALESFARVVAINPEAQDMSATFKQVGDAYHQAAEYDKAAKSYQLLFQHYPNHPDAAYAGYTAASLLAEKVGDVEAALKILQELEDRFPESVYLEQAQYLIGKLQIDAGQAEAAVTTLTMFIESYPDSEWLYAAYLARGDAYLQLRQNTNALIDFTNVIEFDTDPHRIRVAQLRHASSAWLVYTVSDKLPSNQVQAIAIDGDTLWVGTAKGLAQIDISTGSWQPKTEDLDILHETYGPIINVQALAINGQELWIGTLNNGVIQYNKTEMSFHNYNARSELPHNTVYDIEVSENEVWVATFSGIARYERLTGTWSRYDRYNRLPANDIVALATTTNTVWAGTSEAGIAIYDRHSNSWSAYNTSGALDGSVGDSIVSFDVSGEQVFFTWYDKQRQSNGYGISNERGDSSHIEPVIDGEIEIDSIKNIYIAVDAPPEGLNTVPPGDNDPGVPEPNAGDTPEKKGLSPTRWIATDHQVLVYSSDWSEIQYPTDRLGDFTVNCIAIGDGTVWIGTSSGIAKIDTNAVVLPQN